MHDKPLNKLNQSGKPVDPVARTLAAAGLLVALLALALVVVRSHRPQAPRQAFGDPISAPVGAVVSEPAGPAGAHSRKHAAQGSAERLHRVEARVSQLTGTFRQLVKTMDVTADPDRPDHVETKPASEGHYEFRYGVIALPAELQEVLEVQAKTPEGGWQADERWEVRERKLFLLAGQYEVQTDSSAVVWRCVKENRQFRITWR